ncbi:MAG: hypothetical protein ACO3OM_14200 [Alphaproteobacteria bacterium]|jgi:hypothetical protein
MTTRREKVCQLLERYCLIPEGSEVGQPINLLDFQHNFVLDVYDNPAGTYRAWYNDRFHDCCLNRPRQNGRSRCRANDDVWIAVGTGWCLLLLFWRGCEDGINFQGLYTSPS